MVFGYEERNDSGFLKFYKLSWIILTLFGLVGVLFILNITGTGLSFGAMETFFNNLIDILQVLVILSIAALIIGWLQVLVTSIIGEEVVLFVMWVTPIAVMVVSVFFFLQTQEIDFLGGLVAGGVFLGLVIYFRKSLRLSARLIEVGAEITTRNPSLFIPQLLAFLGTVLVTILMISGLATIFSIGAMTHWIVSYIILFLYMIMYFFIINALKAFADASNISYINQWYDATKTKRPQGSKAKEEMKKLKAPILKFAFLMAFIQRFKGRSSRGWTPFELFKLMRFSNWKNVLFERRRVGRSVGQVIQYFGSYTLVVIVVNKTTSLVDAYKESAKTIFKTFVENIAGTIGFNILEKLRVWFGAILLIVSGALYGWTVYADILITIIMAVLFLILGYFPLSAMYQPVVNAYRLILYRAYTGKISNNLNPKTQKIISAAIKK
jgi:hypothetical protein